MVVGMSGRAAALRLKLSPATGARWALAICRTGRAEAAHQGRPRGKGKLDPHCALFAEIIAHDGDVTMPELGTVLFDATGVRAPPNAIGKFLRKLGYTPSPAEAEFDVLTAGFETIQLCL